jgi:hypothetical protein
MAVPPVGRCLAAAVQGVDDNVVARLDTRHLRTGRGDNAGHFVTENLRDPHSLVHGPVEDVKVGAADATVGHVDLHLARRGRHGFGRLQFEAFVPDITQSRLHRAPFIQVDAIAGQDTRVCNEKVAGLPPSRPAAEWPSEGFGGAGRPNPYNYLPLRALTLWVRFGLCHTCTIVSTSGPYPLSRSAVSRPVWLRLFACSCCLFLPNAERGGKAQPGQNI